MPDFRGHTSGFRWNDWYIYSKCMFISVYNCAVLPVSVQHCLCHSKETAHWAVRCLDSLRCSIFYTVGHHQLRRKQHTVQGCITVQRLIFEEIVKWGLRGCAAVGLQGCHMFTMLVYEWEVEWAGWGQLSEELFTCLPSCSERSCDLSFSRKFKACSNIVAFGN